MEALLKHITVSVFLFFVGSIHLEVIAQHSTVNFETRFSDTLLYQRDLTVKDSAGNGIFIQPKISFQLKKRKLWKRKENASQITQQFYFSFIQSLESIVKKEMSRYSNGAIILANLPEFKQLVLKRYKKQLKKEKVKIIDLDLRSFNVYSYLQKKDSSTNHFVRRLVGFEFDIPSNWKFSPNSFCKFSDTTYVNSNGSDGMAFKVEVNYKVKMDSTDLNLSRVKNSLRKGEQVDSIVPVTFNGQKSFLKIARFEVKNYQNIKVLHVKTIYTLQRNFPVVLTFSYYEGNEEEAEQVFKKIENSFLLEQ